MTKTVPVEAIREAFELGCRDFGENRVQELLQKKPGLPAEIRWHFQGRLQTNKVKALVGETALLHSLDRMELAEEIQKQAEKRNITVETLLQVNASGEATKAGFAPEAAEQAVAELEKYPRIRLRGLMTIGPLTEDEARVRKSFERLRRLREELSGKFSVEGLQELSMGMSSDYEWAIEEGATILRIGTAVFGEREYAST